jgi:NDP-sugar pyrophosphorylase family protein
MVATISGLPRPALVLGNAVASTGSTGNQVLAASKDSIHFGNAKTEKPGHIMDNHIAVKTNLNSVTAADVAVRWVDKDAGQFEFVSRKDPKNILAEGRIDPKSGIKVEAFVGKGGNVVRIITPDNRYVLMPGSTYAEGNNYVKTMGEAPSASPLPPLELPEKSEKQTHTDVGMILGAGLSSRIEPLPKESHLSKPAFPIAEDETVIGNSAKLLKEHGIKNLLVNTFYKPHTTQAALERTAKRDGVHTHYLDESKLGDGPSGTAGGLLRVLQDPKLRAIIKDKHLVLMAGDSLINVDVSKLIRAHVDNNAAVTLAGYFVDDKDLDKFGIITTDTGKSGNITGFVEKPGLQEGGLEKIGKSRMANVFMHVFSPEVHEVIEKLANEPAVVARQNDPKAINPGFDFAMDVYPRILEMVNKGEIKRGGKADGKPMGFRAEQVKGFWSDIGNIKAYFQGLDALHAGLLGKAPDNTYFYKDGIAYWDKQAHEQVKANNVTLRGNAVVLSRTADEA